MATAPNMGWMLVVDDDAMIAHLFQQYFSGHGFAVDEATSADQALARASEQAYRIVLSDLRLGQSSRGADGLDLVRELRAKLPACGIIVLTAFADLRTVQEAKDRGANRVLQKPIPLRDLMRVVTEVIASP